MRPGTSEEHHALLQRVLWSHQFEKSARVREFLAYVADRALEDPLVEIHEQEVGHRIFGRPADYDTASDNIVRVTASNARKKLEQYFSFEGVSEPVIIEIPKGQYVPVFRERTPVPADQAADEPTAHAVEKSAVHALRSLRWTVAGLAACTLALVILTIWMAVSLRHERLAARSTLATNPALNSLWSQLLSPTVRTDIVVADSSLSLFQDLLDHHMSLAEYLNPSAWAAADQLAGNPALRTFVQRAAQRHFTSLASVTAVDRIAQIAGKDQSQLSIVFARDFNVRQMKSDNVILLGSKRANPWAELVEDRLNFRFNFDQQSRHSYFENRQPRPGESETYRTDSSGSYCEIALVPNLDKTGNILAIFGTEIEGTEEGSVFVTSERSLVQLQSVVKPDADGRLPYFEVLLKGQRVGGATPAFAIVAFRLLRP